MRADAIRMRYQRLVFLTMFLQMHVCLTSFGLVKSLEKEREWGGERTLSALGRMWGCESTLEREKNQSEVVKIRLKATEWMSIRTHVWVLIQLLTPTTRNSNQYKMLMWPFFLKISIETLLKVLPFLYALKHFSLFYSSQKDIRRPVKVFFFSHSFLVFLKKKVGFI